MNKPTTSSVLEGYLAALLHEAEPEQDEWHDSELGPPSGPSPERLREPQSVVVQAPLPDSASSQAPEAGQVPEIDQASETGTLPTSLPTPPGNTENPDSKTRYHASGNTYTEPAAARHEPLMAAEAQRHETHTALDVDIAVLEEHKRQQLQRLLSSQTLSQPVASETVVAIPPKVTAQEALQAQVERERAAALEQQLLQGAPVKARVVEQRVPEAENLAAPTPADSSPQPVLEAPPELLAWGDFGRPMWAENAFDVLLFEVSGLALAVPLVALGQIVPMANKLTKLKGQSEWFMGILASNAGDIRTINTALFVMPERYQSSFVNNAKYVVTIDGLPWGLAVDKVNQPITLQPDDVKWRSERSKRPWLAGTVKSHMCALIDIPQMAMLLDKLERPRK